MSILIVVLLGFEADASAPWWNYPGLELWKFFNLFAFISIAYFLLGRRLTEALRGRSDSIKRELEKAREERDQALVKLSEVEARLSKLDDEVAGIKVKAAAEAEAERTRLSLATEKEVARLGEQAKREIGSAAKSAKHELRVFAAQESVRLAEQILEQEIKPDDDARLAKVNVEELRRVRA